MNRLLIVAILMLSTAPLYAQGQQQNVAKLKEDARNAVGIIGANRGKTQSYCQIVDLLGQADQENDKKETKALSQRIRRSGNSSNNPKPQSILSGITDRQHRQRNARRTSSSRAGRMIEQNRAAGAARGCYHFCYPTA